ncbi:MULTISPECIES: hypothetical protein [unclassified Thiocapsa]|uniref:hypothetical protein n=1 Tax=unclassified Thiocapsa TaxID=2641286 RepID=UPI0035B33055
MTSQPPAFETAQMRPRPDATGFGGIRERAPPRRISGLTWEQLGEIFDVSRRSMHFWASGKPLNAHNEQRLMQVLDVIRTTDRSDARSTRAALFEVKEGTTAFALLSAEQF